VGVGEATAGAGADGTAPGLGGAVLGGVPAPASTAVATSRMVASSMLALRWCVRTGRGAPPRPRAPGPPPRSEGSELGLVGVAMPGGADVTSVVEAGEPPAPPAPAAPLPPTLPPRRMAALGDELEAVEEAELGADGVGLEDESVGRRGAGRDGAGCHAAVLGGDWVLEAEPLPTRAGEPEAPGLDGAGRDGAGPT